MFGYSLNSTCLYFLCIDLSQYMFLIHQENCDHPEATTFSINNITLPDKFSRRVSNAIDAGQLVTENRAAFVRECVAFYEGFLPHPTEQQYSAICQKICDQYPSLKDKKTTVYWVRVTIYNYKTTIMLQTTFTNNTM